MQQINYNQNFVFPAVYHGYSPPANQQRGSGHAHAFDMTFHPSWLPFTSYIRSVVPQHQPVKLEKTVKAEVDNTALKYSPCNTDVTSCKYATVNETVATPEIGVSKQRTSYSHLAPLSSQTSFVDTPTPSMDTRITCKSEADKSLPSCRHISSSSPRQLRLPTVTMSPSFAANVMSEESDVGYYSLSDGQSSISGAVDCEFDVSSGSDDVFDDATSTFSDFIDDVLDDICKPGESHNAVCDEPPRKRQRHSPKTTTSQVNPVVPTPYSILPCTNALSTNTVDVTTTRQPSTTQASVSKTDLHCFICCKHFQNKTNLKVHQRMHTDSRPHRCSYCDKAFAQKSTLRTHVRTHTGEKPYKCEECARAFSDYSTYRKHVRVHTGERPYRCDVCSKTFAQSGNMIRHREIHYKKANSVASTSNTEYGINPFNTK